jgi:hypothetical protein
VQEAGLTVPPPETPTFSRPGSASSTLRREWPPAGRREAGTPTEGEGRQRQKEQLEQFYSQLDQQKEQQLRVDQESRKHHDTLLPSQKSPVPLNRYEDGVEVGNQASYLNAGKKPEDCKMVARAIFSFQVAPQGKAPYYISIQAQNNRELSFKKGDVIYIKKQVWQEFENLVQLVTGVHQVDSNWYEGERNAMLGIFPTTYVEVVPQDALASQVPSQVNDSGRANVSILPYKLASQE